MKLSWTLKVVIGLFIIMTSSAQAQFVVSGTVVDETLAPMAGVVFAVTDGANTGDEYLSGWHTGGFENRPVGPPQVEGRPGAE